MIEDLNHSFVIEACLRQWSARHDVLPIKIMHIPENYNSFFPIIERVLGSGINNFIQQTGFDATRVITGVNQPIDEIDPFYAPGNPARGNCSGNNRLFTSDKEEFAFLETLGHTGDGSIPENTFKIVYKFVGATLNLEKIDDDEFRSLYKKTDGSVLENHNFSQCVDYYLHSKNYSDQYDSVGWLSTKEEGVGFSGFVHAWKSHETGNLTHVETIQVNSIINK